MGISGLLPLLKDIQVNRPLSEFAGQTIAVDAYVWLHKGIYGCAPELATGKKTHKYVEYAMHRVRLLQHYHIQPYVVFDGGPLPAKKGTESERKKRRDENLARANALAAQGKHAQAREYYVKCIDVTPQMAYQLIKALRAEHVPYVVAPYEADAQLAYLERIGLVDGIITEDSDLLVFGCNKVLFKLDVVASTITCIARTGFAGAGAAGGMSLLGWSDPQFRSMAIMSGCDYLPSIPGVGLKTAWTLLRKHKTVENVVRALQLEGKKKVPEGYLEAFRLAERVFLHQRVYDPMQERLVHLTNPARGEELDAETDAYVGTDIEPLLAKRIAEGDACPITLLPMDDINPTFAPCALKVIPLNMQDARRSDYERGIGSRKVPEKPAVGILGYFKRSPKGQDHSHVEIQAAVTPDRPIAAGRTSGKRTLAEVMDQDLVAKRKKQNQAQFEVHSSELTRSKFFDVCKSTHRRDSEDNIRNEQGPVAGPSCITLDEEDKENLPRADNDDDLFMEDADPVTQEDGYISPSPSMTRWDTPDISSPLRARAGAHVNDEGDDDFGADVLSSPPAMKQQAGRFTRVSSATRATVSLDRGGRVLIRNTPPQTESERATPQDKLGPDLRDTLGEWDWDNGSSDIELSERPASSPSPSPPGPATPYDSGSQGHKDADVEDLMQAEELAEAENPQTLAARSAKVARGWWEKWARGDTKTPAAFRNQTPLRRRETTVTPEGRQRPHSAQDSSKRKGKQQDLRSAGRRRSLVFIEALKTGPRVGLRGVSTARPGSAGSEKGSDSADTPTNRFAEFRWAGVNDSVNPCRI